ncbi:MAG: hypothetical protein HY866_11940 [Chloroflexi bacterium]|nr:hypothetical protein [Chloroflexota bacterium]
MNTIHNRSPFQQQEVAKLEKRIIIWQQRIAECDAYLENPSGERSATIERLKAHDQKMIASALTMIDDIERVEGCENV